MTEEKSFLKPEVKKHILEFLKGIGTIILYFMLTLIGTLLFSNFYKSSNITIATLSQIATYLIVLLGLGIIYHKRLINDLKTFKKEYIKVALKNWLLGLLVMIISNLIITTITSNIAANESLNRELLKAYPISNIIIVVLLAPMIEEITFRASFKKAFNKWYTFAFVTGLIFGLAHIAKLELLEFLFVIPYGALGFFFAKAMYETDNIYSSIIIHILHNLTSVILLYCYAGII